VKTFHIFRHGETDWNAEERFQGHVDIPLNARGRDQARALVETLRPLGLEAIVSSDLSRALETAQIVAGGLGGIPVLIDERLREAHLGGAQGLTKDEIEAKYGKDLVHRWRSWQVTDADVSYPGGETGHAIIARVFAAMESAAGKHPYSRVGIATHGGVIRRVMSKLLPEGSEPVPIPNGVIYELRYQSGRGTWTVGI
jgi:2,3-bisphosphoglycerate-dependent phosphoglycerate mutase